MRDKLPTIPEQDVVSRLQAELPGWTLESGSLRRAFRTDGWPTTVMLFNAIAFVSEAADHHPEMDVAWEAIRVRLMTHDSNGITERDFALAGEIERLALWRPPTGSALTGTTRNWVRAFKET